MVVLRPTPSSRGVIYLQVNQTAGRTASLCSSEYRGTTPHAATAPRASRVGGAERRAPG